MLSSSRGLACIPVNGVSSTARPRHDAGPVFLSTALVRPWVGSPAFDRGLGDKEGGHLSLTHTTHDRQGAQNPLSHPHSFRASWLKFSQTGSALLGCQGEERAPALRSAAVSEKQSQLSLVLQPGRGRDDSLCCPMLSAFGGGIRRRGHQHRPQLQQGHSPRHAPWQQPRPRHHHDP